MDRDLKRLTVAWLICLVVSGWSPYDRPTWLLEVLPAIIALPLLFGLGVDSGIHMAHRLHYLEKHKGQLLAASEAKGVFYGALTTVFSFSSLAFTAHKGTASMGLLLSIGLLYTLICALIVLPAFSDIRIRALRSR